MHQIKARIDPDAVIVSVAGDIDVAAAGELRDTGLRAIKEADGRPVILDVAALTFTDSTGLGALVALNNAASETETTLLLRSVPPQMATLMRLTALDQVFTEATGAAE
jgi:anti-anti-sigma factor